MLNQGFIDRMFICWLSHHSALSYYHESVPALHKLAFRDRLFCVLRGFIATQRIIHPLFLFGFRIANILTHTLVDAPCHWLWCVGQPDLLPRASLAWLCYYQINHLSSFLLPANCIPFLNIRGCSSTDMSASPCDNCRTLRHIVNNCRL